MGDRKITGPVKQENSATANKLHNAYLQITFSNAFAYALESQEKKVHYLIFFSPNTAVELVV